MAKAKAINGHSLPYYSCSSLVDSARCGAKSTFHTTNHKRKKIWCTLCTLNTGQTRDENFAVFHVRFFGCGKWRIFVIVVVVAAMWAATGSKEQRKPTKYAETSPSAAGSNRRLQTSSLFFFLLRVAGMHHHVRPVTPKMCNKIISQVRSKRLCTENDKFYLVKRMKK